MFLNTLYSIPESPGCGHFLAADEINDVEETNVDEIQGRPSVHRTCLLHAQVLNIVYGFEEKGKRMGEDTTHDYGGLKNGK